MFDFSSKKSMQEIRNCIFKISIFLSRLREAFFSFFSFSDAREPSRDDWGQLSSSIDGRRPNAKRAVAVCKAKAAGGRPSRVSERWRNFSRIKFLLRPSFWKISSLEIYAKPWQAWKKVGRKYRKTKLLKWGKNFRFIAADSIPHNKRQRQKRFASKYGLCFCKKSSGFLNERNFDLASLGSA